MSPPFSRLLWTQLTTGRTGTPGETDRTGIAGFDLRFSAAFAGGAILVPAEADPPPIPTVIVAGLLRLIAAGLEPITAEHGDPGATISVATAGGWWLLLRLGGQGEPVELTHAQPPSLLVPPWTWGAQRDDWTLGPESRVVTPIELLTVEQHQQLTQALQQAPAPWTWGPLPHWDLSNLGDDGELILD